MTKACGHQQPTSPWKQCRKLPGHGGWHEWWDALDYEQLLRWLSLDPQVPQVFP